MKLLEGIARFRQATRGGLPWDPQTVVQGQTPDAVMLTCGDSRVGAPQEKADAQR